MFETTSLPASCDAVIVGAGIVGVSAALELTRRGVAVVLIDKGDVGCEQSGRNWGWVRRLGRDSREQPLAAVSVSAWQELQQQADLGYRRPGLVCIAGTAGEMERLHTQAEAAREDGVDVQVLDPTGVRRVMPDYSGEPHGGVLVPEDGCAEPARAAPALARLAHERGARVRTRCAVRGIAVRNGGVAGVETEHGPILARHVLVASGAWSARLLHSVGVDIPQSYVAASAARTAPARASAAPRLCRTDGTAIRPRHDGGWTIGSPGRLTVRPSWQALRWARTFAPMAFKLRADVTYAGTLKAAHAWTPPGRGPGSFQQCRVLDPKPDARALRRSEAAARATHAFLRDCETVERWAGVIDGTPDSLPIIDSVEGIPGLHVATGFSGHGFGLGPGAGRLAADLVSGSPPCVDPAPYRLRRFFDGTPLHIEVGY